MNRGGAGGPWRTLNRQAIAALSPARPPGVIATGQPRERGMNALETAYAAELERRREAREIHWWLYEGLKLKLADNTFYTPDFAVMRIGGELEIHETKGFWREDARLKIKVAAGLYPFRFLGVTRRSKRDGGGWAFEEF